MIEQFNLFVAILLIGAGVYMMIITKFMPLRLFSVFRGLKRTLSAGNSKKEISAIEALSTALAGSIGTGNIAGVSSAIAIGGVGAIFWMWVSGLLGMATKYAETLIAMKFRKRQADGGFVGGAMHCIVMGIGKGGMPLAVLFCVFTLFASLGCGNMVQINTISASVYEAVANFIPAANHMVVSLSVGLIVAAALGMVIIGGAKRICAAAGKLVPIMSLVYSIVAVAVIIKGPRSIGDALGMIISEAFGTKQIIGGVVGFTFARALRVGMTRGIFSNEAGIGSAPIAYASVQNADPVEQGMLGIFEVFIDTILICTLTAFMVLCSDVHIPFGDSNANGMAIALTAFSTIMPENVAGILLSVSVLLFAFVATIGWSLYGVSSAQFLWGERGVKVYRYVFLAAAVLGAVMNIAPVWILGETFNSLMALPNLIMLVALAPIIKRATRDYLC